jgi:ubiquinone/menaquinone biosynthesis C-methylase UbiE
VDLTEYQTSYEVEEVHWWYLGQRHLMVQFFQEHFPERTDLEILDVGCGTGINISKLEEFGRVYGIDVSEIATDYCRKRGHKIVQASVMDMPFSDNSFDVITSLGVFYHREVGDDLQGMLEIFRVLKPGGRLFFFDSAMNCLSGNHDVVFHGVRRYGKPELISKLKEAGFRVEWASYMNAMIFPLAYAKRRLEKVLQVKPKSEVIMVNSFLNSLLFTLSRADAHGASIINYPFGINIVAYASKKRDNQSQC